MNLKRHIALFLLLLVSFKTLVVPFVYLDFELRKEYIISHLCENRFKPQLHCDGKCYLAKQLHKVAEDNARQETQKQTDTVKKLLQEVFDETFLTFLALPLCYILKERLFFYQSAPKQGFLDKLILPPIA
ncbi:MAG TPA: hypothetical protein DCR35_05275 [Runella sp.]|nr:hypothetical protein [Runella sp.]HAO48750.1 hypothetical protein [Runella sp.]